MFWAFLFVFVSTIMRGLNSTYQSMKRKDKAVYVTYYNSLMHAFISTPNAVFITYFICPENKNFFNDFECSNTVLNAHLWGFMFTLSYFIVDLSLIFIYQICEDEVEQ